MLIATIDELKEYLPSNILKDFDKMRNFIRVNERKEILPILGKKLYDELVAAYEGSDMAEKYSNLLPWVQAPLIHFSMYDAVPLMDLKISEAGFSVTQTTNLAPASQARVENFKEGIHKLAFDGVESLLEYLNDNKDTLTSWKESDYYTEKSLRIVSSATEFDRYVFIDKSRIVYQKLLPVMNEVEEFQIRGTISSALVDKILEKVKAGSITGAYKTINDLIKPAVANLTMAAGIDIVANAIYATGIVTHYNIGSTSTADLSRVDALKKRFQDTGLEYLSKALGIILANVNDYPEYKDSDMYDSTITGVQPGYENDEDRPTYVFGSHA